MNRRLHSLAINKTSCSPVSDGKVQMLTLGVGRTIIVQEDNRNMLSYSKDKLQRIHKRVFAKNFRLCLRDTRQQCAEMFVLTLNDVPQLEGTK